MNPFDAHALEEAVRLKEQHGGKVTVLTMGPPQAEAALREAISLGCDEVILLSDRAFAGSDTWATSYTLAKAIEKLNAGIIFWSARIYLRQRKILCTVLKRLGANKKSFLFVRNIF